MIRSIFRSYMFYGWVMVAGMTGTACKKADNNTATNGGQRGPIDATLVADWKQSYVSTIELSTGPGGSTSIPSGEEVDFFLYSDGTYKQQYFNQSSSGCTIVVYGEKSGNWHVDNTATLYLDEMASYLKTTDDCNSALNSVTHPTLRHIKYGYRVMPDAMGKLELHLATTSGDDVFYQ